MDPWAVAAGGAALAGGLLGGQEADVEPTLAQRAAGWMMGDIGRNKLDYVGPGGVTKEALAGARNINMDISPALAYTQKVLSGGFMNNNPYLDRTFDRAAGQVRNRLDTQFAQAGRYGADAHQAVMADQYNNLADDIYGGAYNQERAYMGQAASMLPSLYGQNINNVQGLLSIGSREDQLADEAQNWDVYDPAKRLSLMQAGQGLTAQPYYQNTGAGALGGALGGLSAVGGLFNAFNKPKTGS